MVATKDDGIKHTSFWKTAGLCFSTPVSPPCKLPNDLVELTFRSSSLHVTDIRSVLLNFTQVTATARPGPLLSPATRIQTVCLSARKPAIGVEEESLIGPKHPLLIQATSESMRRENRPELCFSMTREHESRLLSLCRSIRLSQSPDRCIPHMRYERMT